ncbi:MAG: NAD(P)H-dependent oxidoreductase [Planctomycetes bacterium]|nr:NAD(P)H-dependent oxidoreductase [Planctomycetota bacterium]
MTTGPKILAFSGSLRKGSYNQQVVTIAAGGARAAGAEVTVLNLREIPLPVYDADLEAGEGLPDNVRTLKGLMRSHDGFLIGSPENNSTLSAALKNAIDWASRPDGDEPTLACFKDKTAVIMAASPGGLGGLRGLGHLRSILSSIGVLVLPDQKAIPRVHEALAADGTLSDPGLQQAIEALGAKLAEVLAKLHA